MNNVQQNLVVPGDTWGIHQEPCSRAKPLSEPSSQGCERRRSNIGSGKRPRRGLKAVPVTPRDESTRYYSLIA
jgi:hypothetical protein